MSRLLVLGAVFVLAWLPAVPASAQTGPPDLQIQNPTHNSFRYSVNPRIDVAWTPGDCIDDFIQCQPDPGTLEITINGGSNIAGEFWVYDANAANSNSSAIHGIHDLNGTFGQQVLNTIYAKICNAYGCDDQTTYVYIDVQAPTVSTTPLHYNLAQPGGCPAVGVGPTASLVCDAFVFAHGIPGYVSLGRGRSVGVVYSTRSVGSRVLVPFNVTLYGDESPTVMQARLGAHDWVYWTPTAWLGTEGSSETRRLALIKPESTQVGGYIGRLLQTLEIKKTTTLGVQTTSPVDTIPFFFERDSLTTPIARGWSIAGISRIYGEVGHAPGAGVPDQGVLLASPGGAVAYFRKVSSAGGIVTYGRPEGVFASLTLDSAAGRWTLLGSSGVKEHFTWHSGQGFARLDSVVSPGGRTRVTYRSTQPGWPDSIVDPLNHIVRFFYSTPRDSGFAALDSICAPAGANQRCTAFYYSTSPRARVDSIRDPDGVKVAFGYSGSSPYMMTSYTPRALGTFTILYHANILAPSGAVLPGAADTLWYRAPQLAGAALTGGSSGSPAAVAPDTAWGWVRTPVGDTSKFAVDRFGNTTFAKGSDGVIGRLFRNAHGLVDSTKIGSQKLQTFIYNTLGALIKQAWPGNDTTRITYDGDCGSATAYPCLPTQVVVPRTPEGPDTTKWFYGNDNDLLVDSVYRAAHGMSYAWYGSYARVDSTKDRNGHMQRFEYDGTWGNVLRVISDTATACGASCSAFRDTTVFGYDARGWLDQTYNRRHNVRFYLDKIGRDTMVVDSSRIAPIYGIVTKTRFDDANKTVTVIDGKGNTMEFLSDSVGRPVRQKDALGRKDSLVYNNANQVTKWITRRADTLKYEYDGLGRLLRRLTKPGTDTVRYVYHPTFGTVDSIITPSVTTAYLKDTRGRVTREYTKVGGVTRYAEWGYDNTNRVTSLGNPWTGTYTYSWNEAAREYTITNPFSESYTLRSNADGLVTRILFPQVSDSLRYNGGHQVVAAGLNAEVTYEHDSVTRGIKKVRYQTTADSLTQWFSNDGFGRLVKDSISVSAHGQTVESFAYDSAGNRQASGAYVYDSTNAAKVRPAIGGDSYSPGDSLWYDLAGNPVRWKNNTSGAYDSLFWNADNQLTKVKRFTSGGSLDTEVQFVYDGLGRRVKKTVGSTVRYQTWDGWDLLYESDSSGVWVRSYTHPRGALDVPLAMYDNLSAAPSHQFHLDGQGNVYRVTRGSDVLTEYRYRAYGDRYATPEYQESPFTYKGAYEDRETGLMYMRHRYYSPRLERFLNQDPIGIDGGLNTYSFLALDPVNRSDPLGLSGEQCVWKSNYPPGYFGTLICLPTPKNVGWSVPGGGRDGIVDETGSGGPSEFPGSGGGRRGGSGGSGSGTGTGASNGPEAVDVGEQAEQACTNAVLLTTGSALWTLSGAGPLWRVGKALIGGLKNAWTTYKLVGITGTVGRNTVLALTTTGRRAAPHSIDYAGGAALGAGFTLGGNMATDAEYDWITMLGYVPVPGAGTISSSANAAKACSPS